MTFPKVATARDWTLSSANSNPRRCSHPHVAVNSKTTPHPSAAQENTGPKRLAGGLQDQTLSTANAHFPHAVEGVNAVSANGNSLIARIALATSLLAGSSASGDVSLIRLGSQPAIAPSDGPAYLGVTPQVGRNFPFPEFSFSFSLRELQALCSRLSFRKKWQERPMKALIVHAHPERKSFNVALKGMAALSLKSLGHEVRISDLYDIGRSPVLSGSDFAGQRADSTYMKLWREQQHAFDHGTSASGVKTWGEGEIRCPMEPACWPAVCAKSTWLSPSFLYLFPSSDAGRGEGGRTWRGWP
jgi:hypothetical protein